MQEYTIPAVAIYHNLTYSATRTQKHNTIDGRPITNNSIVAKMVGKSYFVSHMLPGEVTGRVPQPIYRMFRLKGDSSTQAALIRQKMCEAKVEMLEEILKHPHCPDYMNCRRNFIDNATPIQASIETVQRFPDETSKTTPSDSNHFR